MICPTCQDKLWIVGVPHSSDPDIDADDMRDWILPCPDCSPNLTLSQVAKLAARDVEVGWSMMDFVAGLLGLDSIHLGCQPWPFRRKGEPMDSFSSWMDREPTLSETIQMDAFDMTNDDETLSTRKLT